jgi:hypothetical protein
MSWKFTTQDQHKYKNKSSFPLLGIPIKSRPSAFVGADSGGPIQTSGLHKSLVFFLYEWIMDDN